MQFQRQLQDKLGEHEPNEVNIKWIIKGWWTNSWWLIRKCREFHRWSQEDIRIIWQFDSPKPKWIWLEKFKELSKNQYTRKGNLIKLIIIAFDKICMFAKSIYPKINY